MFNPYVIVAAIAAFIAVAIGGFFEGVHYETLKTEASASAAKDQVLEKIQLSNQIGAKVEALAVQQIDQIHAATVSQIQEVPKYVTVEASARCILPVGFVRLFNAAAAGLPLPAADPSGIDAAAAGIDLATVGTTTVTDFGAANENAARLKALQAWITAQQKLGS